jgi:hypothetical protein
VYKFDNKSRYLGEWNVFTDTREGKGIRVRKDGSIYEGMWKDDRPNGKGRYINNPFFGKFVYY